MGYAGDYHWSILVRWFVWIGWGESSFAVKREYGSVIPHSHFHDDLGEGGFGGILKWCFRSFFKFSRMSIPVRYFFPPIFFIFYLCTCLIIGVYCVCRSLWVVSGRANIRYERKLTTTRFLQWYCWREQATERGRRAHWSAKSKAIFGGYLKYARSDRKK